MTSRRIQLLMLCMATFGAGCGVRSTIPTPTPTQAMATAEVTTTPSPTPTVPIPTRTPAPGPRLFTEDFRTMPPYWSFLQVDNGQPLSAPSVQDGFLVFNLAAANQWTYAIYEGHDYGEVMLAAHSQDRTGGDGAIGLVCRYDKSKGWYEFDIYADQTYALLYGQWLTEGVARYAPLYQGQSEKIQSDENELGLRCQGNALTPFINGTQLRTWTELKFGLSGGKVGLAVSSFQDAPFVIGFDWAKVSEP